MYKLLLKKIVHVSLVASLLFTGTLPAFAWTGPTTAPPGGNVSAPINTSGTAQSKVGALNVFNGYGGGYPLSVGGVVNGWTALFNWPPGSAPASSYGILVGSSAGGYSQFQNNAGYYTLLANSSWGVQTNGNLYASDMYISSIGQYLTTALTSSNSGHKAGGGFGTNASSGACFLGNYWTGGCSCPAWAPIVTVITSQNDRTGTWYNGYLCIGN